MIFILPETKGISLERMDKIFGEVDAVEAGEEADGDKLEMSGATHHDLAAEADRKSKSN